MCLPVSVSVTEAVGSAPEDRIFTSAERLTKRAAACWRCASASSREVSALCTCSISSLRPSAEFFSSSVRERSRGYSGEACRVSSFMMALRQEKLKRAVVTRVERAASEYICSSHSTMPGENEEGKREMSISLPLPPPMVTPPSCMPLSCNEVEPSGREKAAMTLHCEISTASSPSVRVMCILLPVSPLITVKSLWEDGRLMSSATSNTLFTDIGSLLIFLM